MTSPIHAPSPRAIPLRATFERHEIMAISKTEQKSEDIGNKTHESEKCFAQKKSKWPETLQFAHVHAFVPIEFSACQKSAPTKLNI